MPTRESEIVASVQQILDQVRQVIVGKDEALLWALAAILSGGPGPESAARWQRFHFHE